MPVIAIDPEVEHGRDILGGKAYSLVHMQRLGIDVPPAFVITTDECDRYLAAGELPADIVDALPAAMERLGRITGRSFGGDPALLVSVRSGAATSMPGMMDTILNLGIRERASEPDLWRRFEEQFQSVVGSPPPDDPWEQLRTAIAAVFRSWQSERAVTYRRTRGIGDHSGTAVTVQAMVLGNVDDRSGTGVLFSRDPITGEAKPFGEWLTRAQGEDVVSGTVDPEPLSALQERLPEAHAKLLDWAARLEDHWNDMMDIEFTVERGRLWLLQARAGKRSAAAAVRIAIDLANQGRLTRAQALDRIGAEHVESLLAERSAIDSSASLLASGRPASPGRATGVVVCDVDDAEDRALDGERIVLARSTTSPHDVRAMAVVDAIVTEVGGSTSHAAVVSRELGKPCVVGCGEHSVTVLEGRLVTVDAHTGSIYDGQAGAEMLERSHDDELELLGAWAREVGRPDHPVVSVVELHVDRGRDLAGEPSTA